MQKLKEALKIEKFLKMKEDYITFLKEKKDSAGMYMGILDGVMLLLYLFFVLFPFFFRAPVIILELLPVLASILLYTGFVPVMDKTDKKRSVCKICLRAALILFFVFLVSVPLRTVVAKTGSKALASVWLMLTAMAAIVSISVFCSHASDKFFEALDKGFINALSGKKEVKPGDLVLCNIKEEVEAHARDPREILPAKDRFLHMLILGSTGCGKTSQSLLPMILQDIQNPEWGITVLEPKGDFAIKAYKMAEKFGRKAVYFDPSFKNCSKFNPLAGREIDVVENIATTFKMLNPDSPQFFLDLNEQLIRNAVKVLKRLDKDCGVEGKYATLINLSRLLQNSGGQGRDLVNKFSKIHTDTDSEAKENADIVSWFLNEYFPERSKVYENTSGVRSQVAKLVSNEYLREVLNPDVEKGEKNEVDFDTHLAEGTVICISTAQGTLRDLSKYLGYFIILSLQSSVFRRPGNENTRRPHSLYIDEFQTYSTPGFADMLTQGRSYRVSSILATQARAQMAMGGGKDGKNFVELVSANARNIILYPGLNKDDAKYYSEQFGEYEKVDFQTSTTHKTFNLLTGGFDKLGHPSESIRETKQMTANFTSTDLVYGATKGASFGEITYSIIKHNSLQPAKVGLISYIPKDLNDALDEEIAVYTEKYSRETAAQRKIRELNEQESGSGSGNDTGNRAKNSSLRFGSDEPSAPQPKEEKSENDRKAGNDKPSLNLPPLGEDRGQGEGEKSEGELEDEETTDIPDEDLDFDLGGYKG